MAWVGVGIGLVGLAGSALQAQDVLDEAQLSSELAQVNAKYADVDAFRADAEGASNAARESATVDKAVGSEQEQYAGENVNVNYGSAAAVQTDTKVAGAVNALNLMQQGHNKAMGYTEQAQNIRTQATEKQAQAQTTAQSDLVSGAVKAVDTGLTGYKSNNDGTLATRSYAGNNGGIAGIT